MKIKYRLVKKTYRAVKKGSISAGTAQYAGRQVYHLSKTQPGGNYANPKRRSG